MNIQLHYKKVEAAFEAWKVNVNDPTENKKRCRQFLKTFKQYIYKIEKIEHIEQRKACMMLFQALSVLDEKRFTMDHVLHVEQILKTIQSKNAYLLHEIDQLIFNDPHHYLTDPQYTYNHRVPLSVVRRDLECMVCGHQGAIQAYGSWNRVTKEMSHAVGFGGTIPLLCTHCGNRGLDGMALEGYQVTFKPIENKDQ